MSVVIRPEYVFFVTAQFFALSVLWAFIGNNYLLTLSHFSLWVSLALFEHIARAAAMLAFFSALVHAIFAFFVLHTVPCYKANTINCIFSFVTKIVVSLICGLIDLSIYKISSRETVLAKTFVFAMFHFISISVQWALSTTSSKIILLVLAHVIHWAWYPNATYVSTAVCVVVAIQICLSEYTFQSGSLLSTTLLCAAASILSKNAL